MLSYPDDLDQELAAQLGFKKPPTHTVTKRLQPAQQALSVGISTMEISGV